MKLSDISKELNAISQEQRCAVSRLIDIKMENDMDKVLNAIAAMRKDIDQRFEAVDRRFEQVDKTLKESLIINKYQTAALTVVCLGSLLALFQYFPIGK